ncbi:NADH dehydrogenase [Lentibacillus populi]|uniref:NADH dehydrogenase n=1 Tax=Lentibacillus populi TaxID=1827502 RepID=A0A9W5U0D3_9BACI|nr:MULTISPECIES: CoA-disulfide reductase [Bacillaceae]MBT2217330.1 CoA-disulfide reductase [Virgibacillus dakarensis]GGB50620.1 NADH dehydrogenase [Lentibacillus populi]
MAKKIVIVGGVGGGSTVASQIRRLDNQAEITLFERGANIAFSNCGMPYFIGGTVPVRDDILPDVEKFAKKYNVDVRIHSEVTQIDRTKKSVTYQNDSGKYEEPYDVLILSPGAHASVPPIKGLTEQNTFTLRTIPDMDRINAFINENNPQTCAIVGGGFVGLEMAENIRDRNIDCCIIDHSEHVMTLVDSDMAAHIHDHLDEKGVQLFLNTSLDSFANHGRTLHLNNGKSLETDMTILAVGIKPNTELAKQADLSLGETGAIHVNEFMQTSDPAIYALGDAAETPDFLTGAPSNVALASPAHRQAYIIANHLHHTPIRYQGALGTSIVKVFDLTVTSTGHTSESLKQTSFQFQTVTHEALSNAGYFPGAEKLSIKILFARETGTLLGGQVIGGKGTDKRLAVLATAIKGGLTVADLTELELGYAPPYSSPKDPINIIGYKAVDALNKN